MGFLSSLTGGNTGSNTLKALKTNSGLLNTFDTTGNNIINTGQQQSNDALNAANANYTPYIANGQAANTMTSDALGLNGAEGNAAATSAFQAGPGFQFALDQGTQAAERGASAGGMLASGNTLAALAKFGNGLANQEYGGWLDRLSGVSNSGLTAANGAASVDNSISNVAQNTADNKLGLENTVTQGKMGINTQSAGIKDQQDANKTSFFGNLLGSGLSLGAKALSGGLF